ncbi:hypothetical protein HFO61_24465 [Rhizobium leguminosarum]|nr:hypothetical protein [Rhizobium leguminosarum]
MRNSRCSSIESRSQIRAARTTWEWKTGCELVIAKPLVSAGMVATTLEMTPQAARRIVLELGLREMKGRLRAWGVSDRNNCWHRVGWKAHNNIVRPFRCSHAEIAC